MTILIFSLLLLAASVYLFIKFDNSTDILFEIKNTLTLWTIFWTGFALEIGIDYFLKWNSGNNKAGIDVSYWLLFQLLLAALVSIMVYKKLPNNKNSIFKMFLISIQVLCNFIIYLLIVVFFILRNDISTL